MNKNSNVPAIRFKGFDAEWKQRKLGEVVEDYVEKTTVEDQYPVLTSSQQKGIVLQDDYFAGERVSQNGNIGYFVIPRGYFAFRSRSDNDVFVFNRNDAVDIGIISYFYPVFKPKGVDSDFLLRRLNYGLEDQIKINSEGTGQHVLSLKKFKNMIGAFPSYDEQKKIGNYFKELDNLITLHQRNVERLKNAKKSMLTKLFPKEGARVPEVRFKGFTGDWEQRKFSDFTWNAGKRNSQNLDLEPYAVTNDRGFIHQNEAHDEFGYMKGVDRKAYNIVMPNSFAYNPARINVGSIGYYEGTENVIVSSLYEVFQTADYVDDRFLWHWFKSDIFPKWIERLQEGSVRLYFYYDKLCECKMLMPSLPEQKKIAATLDEIDALITLHQRKYEKLVDCKKAFLHKMFGGET